MRQLTHLTLLEEITAEVYRAKPFGYSATPDQTLEPIDLIVTAGRVFLAGRIGNVMSTGSGMNYMAVGTATAAAALTDTTLPGEIKRLAASVSSAISANVYSCVRTFGGAADSLSSIAITEAGVFNAAASGVGTMFQRVTFAAVTLADSDLLSITLSTNVGSS
jgi:hypothetical protein